MKRKMILIIGVSFLSVCTVSCGKGTFNVTQDKNTIELGDKVDAVKLLNYDPEEISEVIALNAEDLDVDKIGDYSVRFQVRNAKGNTQEMSFDFSVVDTQAPSLNVPSKKIYVPLGTEFNINDYVTSSDKSGTEKIEMRGEVDLGVEGTYDLEIYAVDDSGNQSEKETLTVTVEDRRNCDIRNVKFGDNKETVKRYESLKCIQENDKDLSYLTDLSGGDAVLSYFFNDSDELYMMGYVITEKHTNYNLYISKYDEIKEDLIQKYGDPDKDEKNKGSLYNYCDDEAQALQLGYVTYYSTWDLENYKVEFGLGSDNFDVTFIIKYTSNKIKEDNDLSDY